MTAQPDKVHDLHEQLLTCRCDPFDRCPECRAAHLALTGRPVDARVRVWRRNRPPAAGR